ncbi:hypothetical protein DFH08DRAFT_4628 [Mycena albidolilacea]|uniref:Uncharacterized protein n=1 Tax=Mycena albidolilacea TaxID=1033008 RepID=A0AAD7ATQ6_9AGAR|nr:hypothetical protein DFH08DRAFT_4628 [Mycena albidolilacea]
MPPKAKGGLQPTVLSLFKKLGKSKKESTNASSSHVSSRASSSTVSSSTTSVSVGAPASVARANPSGANPKKRTHPLEDDEDDAQASYKPVAKKIQTTPPPPDYDVIDISDSDDEVEIVRQPHNIPPSVGDVSIEDSGKKIQTTPPPPDYDVIDISDSDDEVEIVRQPHNIPPSVGDIRPDHVTAIDTPRTLQKPTDVPNADQSNARVIDGDVDMISTVNPGEEVKGEDKEHENERIAQASATISDTISVDDADLDVSVPEPKGAIEVMTPPVFILPFVPEPTIPFAIPSHLKGYFDLLRPLFEGTRQRQLIPEMIEVFEAFEFVGMSYEEFRANPVEACYKFGSLHPELAGIAGLVYVRGFWVPRSIAKEFDKRVRTRDGFNPAHRRKQTNIMKIRGNFAIYGYAGQSTRTAVERERHDSGLLLQHRLTVQEYAEEGARYEMWAMFSTEGKSQRFVDMAEMILQGLLGLDSSINHLFMSETFRFEFAPELAGLPRVATAAGKPKPKLAIIMDDAGTRSKTLERNLRSRDIVGQVFLEADVTVVDINHGHGSNGKTRLKPGEQKQQIAHLREHTCAVVSGIKAMEGMCDLRVLGHSHGEFLCYGEDVRSGVVVDALWADTGAPIRLICCPHLGRGRWCGPFSETHYQEHQAIVASIVLAREFLTPHPTSQTSQSIAMEFLESAPARQALINEAELRDIHSTETWEWLKREVLARLPFELLSWVHSIRPGKLGQNQLHKASKSKKRPICRLARLDLNRKKVFMHVPVNHAKWSKKSVREGEYVQWGMTASHFVAQDSAGEIRMEMPLTAAANLKSLWPTVIAGALYESFPMDVLRKIVDHPERNRTMREIFQMRVPNPATQNAILTLIAQEMPEIQLEKLASYWRLLSWEDEGGDLEAFIPVEQHKNHFQWQRNLSHSQNIVITLPPDAAVAGEFLRPVISEGRLILVDQESQERWSKGIAEVWRDTRRVVGLRRLIGVGLLMGMVNIEELPNDPERNLTSEQVFKLRVPDATVRQTILKMIKRKIPDFRVDRLKPWWRLIRPEDDHPESYVRSRVNRWQREVDKEARASIGCPSIAKGQSLRSVVTNKELRLFNEEGQQVFTKSVDSAWEGTSKEEHWMVAIGLVMGAINPSNFNSLDAWR